VPRKEKETPKEQEQEQQPAKRGLIKWIVLGVVAVLLLGAGYYAYLLFFTGNKEGLPAGNATEMEKPLQIRLVSIQPFVVNLADPLGRRFLKVSMDLELSDERSVLEINQAMPKVKDTILLLLSSKNYSDLAKMEDKLVLKKEIVDRVGQVIGAGKVNNVYFTEFVIQ
jgi:flagellar protein FliL